MTSPHPETSNQIGSELYATLKKYEEYIRKRSILLFVSDHDFEALDQYFAEIIIDLRQKAQELSQELAEGRRETFLKVARYLVDIVQESCAELVADWKEGLEYQAFRVRIQEEKELWFDQLTID